MGAYIVHSFQYAFFFDEGELLSKECTRQESINRSAKQAIKNGLPEGVECCDGNCIL